MTPPPPTPNPTPKADSGAGATPRAICKNCGEEQHDQIDRICMTCGFAMLESVGANSLPTPPQSDPALAAAEASIGVSYQSACSGLWYSNASAAGTIRAIKIGVEIYELKQDAPAPAPEGRGETPATVQPIEYLTRYTCSVNGMVPAEDGPWVSFRQAKAAQDEVRESANYWNQQWNTQTIERDAAVACETKIRQYITEAMGHEACEGCDTPQLVAILISQRDNARNESDALKTAHASASRCARAAEAIELRKQLETKEQHRQYHMNAINRLAKVVGAEGEQSEDVVSVAVAAVAQARALREGLTRLVAFKFELFEDGLSADLHDEGIEGASAGYLRGIQDACDELKAIAAAALAASEAGK